MRPRLFVTSAAATLLGAACAAGTPASALPPPSGASLLEPIPFRATSVYDEKGAERLLPPCDAPCRRGAVLSFYVPPEHELHRFLATRSFVYDDALAMVFQLSRGELTKAEAFGRTLESLVTDDGTLGFSFGLEQPSFYNENYVRAGTVAWAAYALALHDELSRTSRFGGVARRLADRLLTQRVEAAGDPRRGLVLAGRGRWRDHYRAFEAGFAADYCVTEHQIDTYFLLQTLAARDDSGRYAREAAALGDRLVEALWLPEEGRFATAVDPRGPVRTGALDAAGAWGVLFLLARGDGERAARSLAYTRASFRTRVDGLDGFAPYSGRVGDHEGVDLSRTLFSEGTAGVALALLRMGHRAEAERTIQTLRRLQHRGGGGVPYAVPPAVDFPDFPAVAPTAWLMLIERELAGGAPILFAPR